MAAILDTDGNILSNGASERGVRMRSWMAVSPATCLDETIEGAVNLRDLGGYRAGNAVVRRGVVFRSGMTHHISEAGVRALVERYGLRTVIDLRAAVEHEQDGFAPFEPLGLRVHLLPVADNLNAPAEEQRRRYEQMRAGTFDWAASYLRLTRAGRGVYRRFFEVLAEPDALPAVFHCTAGRDRTGVAAALLLSVLGVSRADVAHDYALSGVLLRPHVRRFIRASSRMQMTEDELARVLETRHDAMDRFLDALSGEYGSVEGYLADIGVTGRQITVIREALLDRA
jgi:protein-tyrosine phosphatase